MVMWCEPLQVEINSTKTCELRRRNPEIEDCDGCAGPIEKIPEHNEQTTGDMVEIDRGGSPVGKDSQSVGAEDFPPVHKPSPEILQCRAEGCETIIKGTGKTGLCRIHSIAEVHRKYGKKSIRIRKEKARVREEVREKKICKKQGCDTVLHRYNRSGFCNRHKRCPEAQAERENNGRGGTFSAHTPANRGGTFSARTSKADKIIHLDFSDYPELLAGLQKAAKDEFRNLDQQMMFILSTGGKCSARTMGGSQTAPTDKILVPPADST